MKLFPKALSFLAILTALDFLLRKGFIGFLIPIQLPHNILVFILFTAFAYFSILVTRWFCRSDKITLAELGISFDSKNRVEFYFGLLAGILLWGIVSFAQAYAAGFSWELRDNISLHSIFYGLLFIFVADLGTEVFTRGYPLQKISERFGATLSIIIMFFFVGLKSVSLEASGELFMYIILIPALHTIFFSIIYFKTKRLGAALGVHTGANFVTISIFDLRVEQARQAIPSGIFKASADIETLSLTALQLPFVFMALLVSFAVYLWWKK
jgi:membrane protease YdiL (CAAX protease family)